MSFQDRLSPHTADFILTRDKLDRRKGSLLGLTAYYESPESLVLAKLRMIKTTRPLERSLKDRNDVKAIITHTKVDRRRIARRAGTDTTLDIFRDLAKAA